MVPDLLLTGCAGLLLAFASLTALRVPVAVNWRLALLAGEYGHWFLPVPVALALFAWGTRGTAPGLTTLTVALCAGALCLLLKPSVQAAGLAARGEGLLPSEWRRCAPGRPAFSLRRLFGGHRPEPVSVETRMMARGLALDFYRPPHGAGPAPCVVVIHGGGWDGGDRTQMPHFNHWLARQGYAVAAISYRLAPQHLWPAQREDTLEAIAHLKAHASELRLDPTRVVLCGRSAGGQIAAAVGYTANDPAIRGVVALYAPFDMRFVWSIARGDDALNSLKLMTQYFGGPPDDGRAERYETASAQGHVRRGVTPPTLLVHGVIDTLVWHRHSERLAARLAEEEVPHVFLSLPWAVHAFEYNLSGPAGQLTLHALETFLAATTRSSVSAAAR